MLLTNKNKTILIAFFLTMTIAFSMFAMPNVDIAKAATYDNYANVTATPNPAGVGQTVTILFFLSNPSPIASAGFNPDRNWNNYALTITSPSGKVEHFGPFTSDATGGNFQLYVPTEVGQYKIDFNFPGQTVAGNYYTQKNATTNLTVQQEAVPSYQTPPLPTDYWTRPIYGENRGWYQVGGNWLNAKYNNTVQFNPYTTAPNTAHIVWARNQYIAGVVGGDYGDLNYYQAPTYQSYWVPPLIMNGRLYYMERQVPGNGWVGLHCVDIRTGQQLWFKDVSLIGAAGAGGGGVSMNIYGQVFDAEGVNGHGAEPFIWNLGTNWTVFDANSGTPVYSITNVTQATGTISGPVLLTGGVDPLGSIIAYYMDGTNNWLLKWNSTQMLSAYLNPISNLYTPPLTTIDWRRGIVWNVTIPHLDYPQTQSFGLGLPSSDGNYVFSTTTNIAPAFPVDNFTLAAYSCADGHLAWTHNFGVPFVPGSTDYEFFGPVHDGVMCVYVKDLKQWYGFDENTGQRIWGPTQAYPDAWDAFETATAGYGNLYVGTYAGKMYAYNIKTGVPLWNYTLPPSSTSTPYGTFSLSGGLTVADGKIYAITGEHTPNSPYWVGGAMYAVNASTGDFVYKMSGWWSAAPAIVDGYALDHNCYDGTIYSFGKGQTSTTVTAPDTSINQGQNIVIKGTVMDESPGALNYAGDRISTKSTPAIADLYMTQWMEYLYQQKPKPTNATGVSVSLDVVDANNNFRHIGDATSDNTGAFSYVWTPDIPGKYTLIASFAGSESYFRSSAETSFQVDPAPIATAAPTPIPQSAADMYFVPAIAGLFVLIIIVLIIVALLMLRKRP